MSATFIGEIISYNGDAERGYSGGWGWVFGGKSRGGRGGWSYRGG